MHLIFQQRNIKLKVKILQCDSPNTPTGRIYPREAVEQAVKEFNEKYPDGNYGLFGFSKQPEDEFSIERVSHKTKNITIEDDGSVMADIELLDTPIGETVELTFDVFRVSPALTGKVKQHEGQTLVSDITILYTAIVPKHLEDENE